jgi:phage terminase large subunit
MFPAKLERQRVRDQMERPESYDHVWEGKYASIQVGAYYTKQLMAAREERRIGRVSADPLMTIRLFCDIGGTGARADAFACWAAQFIGREIRALSYYEAVGQPMDAHVAWMRLNGYTPDRAQIWLPHDGTTHDKVYLVTPQSALESIGYTVTTVKNQGPGAAMGRVHALRRVFPMIWFNEATCEPGLDALAFYHEKRDDKRDFGLGPEHDWSSHGSDAAGLMAIVYEEPAVVQQQSRPRAEPDWRL